jgi:hypothetical protein
LFENIRKPAACRGSFLYRALRFVQAHSHAVLTALALHENSRCTGAGSVVRGTAIANKNTSRRGNRVTTCRK